jgi:hypothetical protein
MAELTQDQALAERLEQLFAPALFADGLGGILLGELLLRDLPVDHPRRPAVAWRWLELRLALDPAGVLAQIDRDPPPTDAEGRCQRVPIAAMLACGHYDRAADALAGDADHSPAAQVLRGQLAVAQGDAATAEAHLVAARATATDPEDRAAALLWSLEAASRRDDAVAVTTWAAELDQLLAAHGAETSRQMLAMQTLVAQIANRGEFLAPVFATWADQAKQALCADVAEEQAQLGPIPRHVHAAYRKLRARPRELEAALLNVAGLQVRAEQREEALATLTYAARLAPRLLPADAAARWQEVLAGFRAQLGAERCAEYDAYLRLREETFLATMRAT